MLRNPAVSSYYPMQSDAAHDPDQPLDASRLPPLSHSASMGGGYARTPMPSPPLPQPSQQDLNQSRPHADSDLSANTNATLGQDGFVPHAVDNTNSLEGKPDSDGRHYGPAPTAQRRRYHTTKKVKLTSGNLVLDCPVPSNFLKTLKYQEGEEFTHIRYTAATCDPNDFAEKIYTLRSLIVDDQPRETELFIFIGMESEDEVLFTRTMHGVMRNIRHLTTRYRSRTWGPDAWKKVVVCIVSDGRKNINVKTLNVLTALGVYQNGIAKNIVNDKAVTAHIYEYTTQVTIDPEMGRSGHDKGYVPVQILFCLKEKKSNKLNSHRWFFNAFGQVLKPNICVLLDVGIRPSSTSIYHLWKAFDLNSNVAGACGEIRAMLNSRCSQLISPLVASQNFEYKMSNILDKPLESVFGYVKELPGSFSAYRYRALQNDPSGQGPLREYFLGEKFHGSDTNIFTANKYLAEGRILCFELVTKRNAAWVLQYVKSAYGEKEVPSTVAEFIEQRRQWINGSFFASVYTLAHCMNISRSEHSLARKWLFQVQFLYSIVSLVLSWFALGNLYLTFYILGSAMVYMANDDGTVLQRSPFGANSISFWVFTVTRYIYILLIIVQFILSMGNRPKGLNWAYSSSMGFFAILTGYMLFGTIYTAVNGINKAQHDVASQTGNGQSMAMLYIQNVLFRNTVMSLASTYGLYFFASFWFLEPWHMFHSFIQYLFMAPSYINVLHVFAFCNIHDTSRGTESDTSEAADLGVAKKTAEDSVEVSISTYSFDINESYDEAVLSLSIKTLDVKQSRDVKTKQEDYYRGFRTRMLLLWVISNGLLVTLVTSTMFEDFKSIYLRIVLWTVAGQALVKLIGSVVYMPLRLLNGRIA
ncbi:Chitin synthase, class 1 [Podila clonocystis]|nr:Chitin synthase, class 1 [Podila clonocystis]